ncbi:MAG: sulfatase/phosphatase domain-containing protein, partial [Planctomycetota bacterium]
ELAGVERPAHVEFNSILPILDGAQSPYPVIYGAFLQLQRCIRTKTHKLVLYPKAKVVLLFDLTKDPEEMDDLPSDPASRTLMKELFAQLLEQQEQMEDALDLASVFPELAAHP